MRRLNVAQGQPTSGRCWPWSKHFTTLYYAYRRILLDAKLPTDRMRKFHAMRRSAASYLEAAGGNATGFLDHSDRRTTKRSYLDPRICGGDVTACDVLFRPSGS